MVKIERPSTLFGRYTYLEEQAEMLKVTKDIFAGAFLIKPSIAVYTGSPLSPELATGIRETIRAKIRTGERLSDIRKTLAKMHFTRAKERLEGMGV